MTVDAFFARVETVDGQWHALGLAVPLPAIQHDTRFGPA
jgi:hypothetical protein